MWPPQALELADSCPHSFKDSHLLDGPFPTVTLWVWLSFSLGSRQLIMTQDDWAGSCIALGKLFNFVEFQFAPLSKTFSTQLLEL